MFPISYKYNEVYNKIKYKIQNNLYPPNTLLPPENTLTEDYQVSRITIRNSLSKLIEEGYVIPVPGKGNYVLPKMNDKFTLSIKPQNLLKESYNRVELVSSHIIKPTIDLVYHLQVHPDSRLVVINWRLSKNDITIAFDNQYIPYFPGITLWKDDFEYTSFSDIVKKRNNCDISHEEIQIKAINCNQEIAENLNIQDNTPIMMIIQKSYAEDEVLGLRRLYIRKEWCRLAGESYIL